MSAVYNDTKPSRSMMHLCSGNTSEEESSHSTTQLAYKVHQRKGRKWKLNSKPRAQDPCPPPLTLISFPLSKHHHTPA